jgi:hypothetical protein
LTRSDVSFRGFSEPFDDAAGPADVGS